MNSLVWSRNDLRVTDNTAFYRACTHEHTIAVYCFDPRHFETSHFGFVKTERFRAQFLRESVEALKIALREKNISLLVYHDIPENVIPQLVQDQNIDHVYLQTEWTPEEYQVFENVKKRLPNAVQLVESCDYFLFHPEDICFASFEEIREVFTFFRKKCKKYTLVRPELPEIAKKPPKNYLEHPTTIPSLKVLGLSPFTTDPRSAFPFKGGEKRALQRIRQYFWETKNIATYKTTRNGLIGTSYSSKFSPCWPMAVLRHALSMQH